VRCNGATVRCNGGARHRCQVAVHALPPTHCPLALAPGHPAASELSVCRDPVHTARPAAPSSSNRRTAQAWRQRSGFLGGRRQRRAAPLARSLRGHLPPPSRLRAIFAAMASAAEQPAKKARTALDETKNGEFVRTAAGFRDTIAPNTRFPPESGRYHLYISLACPWACRCASLLYMKVRLCQLHDEHTPVQPAQRSTRARARARQSVRALSPYLPWCAQGLEDAIGLSITHPTWQRTKPDVPGDEHTGWVFRAPSDPPLSRWGCARGSCVCRRNAPVHRGNVQQ
jgi:hypothetical protein